MFTNKFKQLSVLAIGGIALLLPISLTSCGKEESAPVVAAPLTPTDIAINSYEKSAKAFVRAAKQLKRGDVSVTIRYIDLKSEVQKWPAKLQAMQLNPAQAQRVAAISAKAAPYLTQ